MMLRVFAAVLMGLFIFFTDLVPGVASIAIATQDVVGPASPAAPQEDTAVQGRQQTLPIIRQIAVSGNQRVEPATVLSYLAVREGDPFDQRLIDISLKSLTRTGLFSDVEIFNRDGILVIRVVENPIINRVVFLGNKRVDNEKLGEEVQLRPRQIFTRSKVRADVQRMLQVYRSSGRFAAIIEPKVVQLEQNRVDVLFEIQEGPKTKIRRINFIGNKKYSDNELRDVLVTKESRWWKFFTSNDTFDPDRQAYDQQVLRDFYFNEGYADFRTVSAVAELTPNREEFFVTFTIEEGELYKFGKITVRSEIRDIDSRVFQFYLGVREGQTYNFERIQQTIERLTGAAGLLGYAFVQVDSEVKRDRVNRTIDIEFVVNDAPRVYVERVNIRDNVRTIDKVVRREIRLQEGDAFNTTLINRSEGRLRNIGYFREVSIDQRQGSAPDRIILDVTVEEQATGQLNLSAGFSSLEQFFLDFRVSEDNFAGTGRQIQFGTRFSQIQQQVDVGIFDPYFLDRTIGAGFNVFIRRQRPTAQFQTFFSPIVNSRGFSLNLGTLLNEFWTLSTRYSLRDDDTSLAQEGIDDQFTAFLTGLQNATDPSQITLNLENFDNNGDGQITEADFDLDNDGSLDQVEQLTATGGVSSFFLESLGSRIESNVGYTLRSNTLNSIIRPTAGRDISFSQDFAGVGGDVRFLRSVFLYDNYWTPFRGWTFRHRVEAGIIDGLGSNLRTIDRFFIGGPRIRGFDNAGIGPRVFVPSTLTDAEGLVERGSIIGGTAYYLGRGELFLPLGDAALESGVQASVFVDAGSSFRPQVAIPRCDFGRTEFNDFRTAFQQAVENGDSTPTFDFETSCILGASPSPRVAVGLGVSWQSPFGPFRIDLTRALRTQLGDDTQTLQFNVGGRF